MIIQKKLAITGLALTLLMASPSAVNCCAAEKAAFVTKDGYALTQEQYDKISQVYNDDVLYQKDRETIDYWLSDDDDTVYIQVDELYDADGNYLGDYEQEITKQEAAVLEEKLEKTGTAPLVSRDFSSLAALASKTGAMRISGQPLATHSTNMKILTLTDSTSDYASAKNIVLKLTWKKPPKTRSFDVIAIRPGVESSFFSTTSAPNLSCEQTYFIGNTKKTITYNAFGDHCVKKQGSGITVNGISGRKMNGKTHGCGFSMNLVNNSNATDITCTMKMTVKSDKKGFVAYGSYQHAQKSVSLTESKNYNISYNGFGKVILFDDNIKGKYDNMLGVSVALP